MRVSIFCLIKCLSLALVLSTVSACYYLQSESIPMEHTLHPALNSDLNSSNKQLLILLPGIGDTQHAFEHHGFIGVVQQKVPTLDVITVNAHFKYYQSRSLLTRLYADVIKPAQDSGYENIKIGGISLGGFGSLKALKAFPDSINGVILLAPYLGESEDFEYLISNQPQPAIISDTSIWPWLSTLPESIRSTIYLAYGQDDKFALQNALLGSYLADSHKIERDGKHNWQTWKRLWPEIIERAYLAPIKKY